MFQIQIQEKMQEIFKDNIPNTLYMNYQELQQSYGFTQAAWENLLDDPDFKRHIDIQLAKYLEIEARKALQKLANAPHSTEVSGLIKTIESSKLLQQKHNQRQNVVLTYLPRKDKNNVSNSIVQAE